MPELPTGNDLTRSCLCHPPVCAFCNNPKLLHEQGLKRICRYLYLTRAHGLVFKPNPTDGFKCYVDADWARNWLKTHPNDKTGALSRTGYLITYAICPIMWVPRCSHLSHSVPPKLS